tara:strand:- start:118 stop:564 length:447 start_codon:yes stop_codon:yes gene_type:complete
LFEIDNLLLRHLLQKKFQQKIKELKNKLYFFSYNELKDCMIKKSTYIDTSMNTNEIKTYRLIIKGKVQGVGFRHWFSDLAISLGLNGYIQNKESKDEVEAIIQGDMQSILSITEKAKDGPSLALVEGVIPNSIISNVKYSGFIVKYET